MDRLKALRILCCLGLLAAGLTPAAVAAPAPQVNARKLVRMAEDAWSRAARAARGKLDRRGSRDGAFWMSMDRMQVSLSDVGTTLRQRDLAFFRALRSGSVALAQLWVVWSQSGVKDPGIDREIRTLTAAYRQLRNRYGPEWVRYRTGKPLDDQERLRFERMRAEQARLAGQLEPLRDRAAAAGDKAIAGQLALLILQAQSIANAATTLDELLEASVLSDAIRGEWYGTRAVNPTAREDWIQADDTIEQIYTDDSVGFVFTAELGSGAVQGWDFVEEETDLSAEIAREEIAPRPAEIQAGEVLVFEGPEEPGLFEEEEPAEGEEISFDEVEEVEEAAPEEEEAAEAEGLEAPPAEPGEAAAESRPEPGASKSSDLGLATEPPATSPLSRRGAEGRWERGTGGEAPPKPPQTTPPG